MKNVSVHVARNCKQRVTDENMNKDPSRVFPCCSNSGIKLLLVEDAAN